MNNKKYFLALTAVALLTITACSNSNNKSNEQKSSNQPVDSLYEEIKNLPNESDENVISELNAVPTLGEDDEIHDGVYGNVYLPENLNGAKLTWWSSDPNVINPKWEGDAAPGVVNRPTSDTDVTLIAKIEKDGNATKYEQTVTVKGLDYTPEDEDFEAYLFGHFIGEGTGTTVNGQKIATGEQIFFALADVGQGLHFKDMNGSTSSNLKPVLSSDVGECGVRDPFMCRSPEGDTFYLIATDLSVYVRGGWNNNAGQATKTGSHSIILWESHDLVNWTHSRQIPVAREDAGMAWAPEMIFCEETGEYYIFFSSTVLDDYSKGLDSKILERDCVYYTTTRDFVHFGETKKFISNTKYQDNITSRNERDNDAINNDYRKVIDGSAIKIGDYYYSACKDGGNNEDGGGIRIMKTETLIPEVDDNDEEYIPWEFVMNLADAGYKVGPKNNPTERDATNKCLEGPEWFFYNVADRKDPDVPEIGLMADYYANTSVGYIPFSTTDIEDVDNSNHSWRKLEDGAEDGYSWDSQTKRHGTILRITAEEAERLKEAYPIA